MNRRKIKKLVIETLGHNNLEIIYQSLGKYKIETLVNPLFSSLCHTNEQIRWHGISVLGKVINKIADNNIEDARIIMRRFLWMLNDESGGIGWGVPEAMAEAMINNATLADEYIHMLVSYTAHDGPELCQQGNFLELPFLQRGVLWGLCRVSTKYSSLLLEYGIGDNLVPYFNSTDDHVVGLAWCLSEVLGLKQYWEKKERFYNSEETISIYLEGCFFELGLAEIVNRIVRKHQNSINPFLNIPR